MGISLFICANTRFAFVDDILQQALNAIKTSASLSALDDTRIAYLGKQGKLTTELKTLGKLPPEARKAKGQQVNEAKAAITAAIEAKKAALDEQALNQRLATEHTDITLPAPPATTGLIHPVSRVIEELVAIFQQFGFYVADGPLIEDDFHNFTALNIPESHPARQMHDTFYLQPDDSGIAKMLRTHTSPVQIRAMVERGAPIRVVAPGATFRCDSDQTHTPMFHQIEGLVIDKNIHMGHLKGCLNDMLAAFFGIDKVPMRFRPSFFPFTEPSAEVDIGCERRKDTLKIGAGTDWLEVAGCGMVHPNVLKHCGIDPDEFQGFAFGFGLERLAMLKYNIPDLRTFFTGDLRWIRHYGFAPTDMPNLSTGVTS
jgi:phenylalanyl-tRNA synthetase alpha chain